jgi:hypothetical protein
VAAKGARIGNADLEETTNALTATIQSGIAKNQSYAATMSDLLTIVGTGDMKLSDFNEALGSGLLATMANAGIDIKDVGAALAVFGDNNIRGANAATMLRVAVQALQSPAKGGAAALDAIGIKADTLRNDLLKGGLNAAVTDLRDHLDKAGYSGKRAGALLVEAFGKKANTGIGVLIHEYDLLQTKYGMLNHGAQTFEQRWNTVTQTASFHLAQLGHEAEATGISLAEKATPAMGELATLLATALPAGLHVAGNAFVVFHAAAHAAASILGPLGSGIGEVAGVLHPLLPILSGTGSAAIAMWVAFKGYQIARDAVHAVADGVAYLSARTRNGLADMRGNFNATNAQLATQSAVMRAEFAQIEAAALADAAATDRAAAIKAVAYADEVAASKAATDAQVANAEAAAAAALGQAQVTAEAAAASAAAATESAAAIDTAGAEASLGWSAVLGPLALAAIGVMTVVSLFHRSETASKEATAAAKAYTDALKGGANDTTIVDSISKQLADAKLPENLRDLNKALGSAQYSGKQFVNAIENGGKPLDTLRSRLEAVVKAGTSYKTFNQGRGAFDMKVLSPAAEAASKALGHLNTQYIELSKSARKDLLDTKTFAGVSSSIDKVSQSTRVSSDTAKRYAEMTGIIIDKNGIAAVSQQKLSAAVAAVSSAYAHATQTGDAFLSAEATFSQSQATAADRAALIGATLKAGNGDRLNYAAQMNAAAVATHQLGVDAKDAAKNAVKGGESTKTWLKSVVDLKKGTIDYSKAAAAPLISDLQAIQTAGMNAAEATYQHAKATMSGKDAAAAAYKVYVGQTRGALIDQFEKLGANSAQAKRLADKYLGMPKQVKTLIEAEGTNPIVTVLNKIGTLLANLTGQQWDVGVNVIISRILRNVNPGGIDNPEAHKNQKPGKGRAAGGRGPEGLFWVGEGGAGARPELVEKHGSDLQVYSYPQAVDIARRMGLSVPGGPAGGRVPGFASGTNPGKKYELGDVSYKTKSEYLTALQAATGAIAAVLAAARNANASAADVRAAAKDLRAAARDQKLSAAFQKQLATESGRLNDLAQQRDRLRARLGSAPTAPTAYERLASATQQYASDKDRFSSPLLGFDLTSVQAPTAPTVSTRRIGAATIATTTPTAATVTAASIIAADSADVAKAKEFDHLLRRLVAEGLNEDDVAQIAVKGPDAIDYAKQLAKATPAQIRKLNRNDKTRKATANDVGTFLAKQYDQAGVNAARGLVNGLLSQEKTVEAAADRIAAAMVRQMKKRLGIKSPSRVAFDIAAYVGQGAELGLRHKTPHVQAAADRLARAMVPNTVGGAGSLHSRTPAAAAPVPLGGGTKVEFNVYGQPGQSPAEIGHIAASDLMFHLDR